MRSIVQTIYTQNLMGGEQGLSLRELICEAVALLSSPDNVWVPMRQLFAYFHGKFPDLEPETVDRKIHGLLKKMVNQRILVRKGHSFSLLSADTNIQQAPRKRGPRPKKDPEPIPMKPNLGPDVVITKSGRVSLKVSFT